MKRETSIVSMCVLTAIVFLMLFLVMFRMGFEEYSEATADRIASYSNDALWEQRHATIMMADSVLFLVLGLIFMAIALAVHDKSKNE